MEPWGTRIDKALRRPMFAAILAATAVFFFSWPMFRSPPPPPTFACLFLFGTWACVIFILFLMARSQAREPPQEHTDNERSRVQET
jgi:hypothetical protein